MLRHLGRSRAFTNSVRSPEQNSTLSRTRGRSRLVSTNVGLSPYDQPNPLGSKLKAVSEVRDPKTEQSIVFRKASTTLGARVSPAANSSDVSSQSTLPSFRAIKPSRLAAM